MTPMEISANLRNNALNMQFSAPTPASLSSAVPFGLVCEFRQGDAVVTIAAFHTGDVSLYFSTGGGILGGVARPDLSALARAAIDALPPLLPHLQRSDATEPPEPGEWCFYVLTPSGRFTARAKASDRVTRDGPIVKLVELSGALLTKIREADQATG